MKSAPYVLKPASLEERGFTLVELLLALVIVGVLIFFSFAAGQRYSQKTKTLRCLSNLRAISGGLFAYAADHNSIVMPKVQGPSGAYWHPFIDSYLGGRGKELGGSYVTSPSWVCPENSTLSKSYQANGRGGGQNTGYVINRHLTRVSDDGVYRYGVPMSAIQSPSRKVYIIECCNLKSGAFGPATTMLYTPSGYKDWMKQVHPVGNSVLFCDGHVESISPSHDLCSNQTSLSAPWWLPER